MDVWASENSLSFRGIETRFVYFKARTLAIVLAKSFFSAYLQTLIFSSSCNNSILLISAFKFASTYFILGQSNLNMKKIYDPVLCHDDIN